MDLDEMISQTRSVTQDSAGNYITDDDITDWLNTAYLNVVARERLLHGEDTGTWGDAGTSVANGTLDFPADFIHAVSLRIGTADVQFVDDDLFWEYSDENATPANTFGRVWNDKIEVYPLPENGASYRLRYVKKPTALSSGGDEIPDIGEEYHFKLVRYAQAMALLKQGTSLGEADRYRADYEEGLAPLTPRNRHVPGPMVMQVAGGPFDTSEATHN